MPKVSVIVPVYNAEQYLHRCIDSILSQKFSDFELILVDDGSKDLSASMCDEYKKKDGRIKVRHQKNAGAAAARNTGIDMAEGEYLAFCDSDDIVSSLWLERLTNLAQEDVLPIGAYCQEKEMLGSAAKLLVEADKLFPISMYYYFNIMGVAGYLCNALYNRVIVEKYKIRIREQKQKGDYNEDLLFALTYVQHIKSIVYTGYFDYCYEVRAESLSHGNQKYYFEKYAEKYTLWREFIRNNCKETEKDDLTKLSTMMLYHILTALRKNTRNVKRFFSIARSEKVKQCLAMADTSKENQIIISELKKQHIVRLWICFAIHEIKERMRIL